MTAPSVSASTGHATTRTYLVIWAWLAGLMLLGVGLSELPIPKMVIILGILALSSVKAILVALYYMHLKFDRKTLTLVAVFPLVIILLAILLVLSSRFVVL
jgi:cytochrome c oxidase subunit 4